LITLLNCYPEIKNHKVAKFTEKETLNYENTFPPIYVDRNLYEGETSIFNIEEIQTYEITFLVFWCMKY